MSNKTETLIESVNNTVYDSVNKTIDESVNESVNKTIDESVNESVNKTIDESVSKSIDKLLEKSFDIDQELKKHQLSIKGNKLTTSHQDSTIYRTISYPNNRIRV
ncbi:hypothetical protein QJ850_gp928 [Acanthamoeba polyphaga mimivirus]|uniref:Uncharacterized protein n=1 Tax=Acanthamoeba polyphaga mimivirus Kroon TaxID=3069720 RepID=A0A0G2Y9I3_9VIRU|nr:hypothetical protein QJ850_gp928 [Acanthamoeba polyphaga mimivirus]AKI79771.1 hypothetical protein [Acanthamoeba polyphaga mimivirus Kroon]